MPSNLYAISTTSLTSGSFFAACAKTGCSSFALSRVIPGANGIIFDILSPNAYGLPIALATSLTTALAAIVPNVAICDTASLPYLLLTYSITLSLFSIQKSISKSGIDILSGLRKRSNSKP